MLSEEIIEKYSTNASGLAKYFSEIYYKEHERKFPLNPFRVLNDLNIHFVFRNFDNLEGLYFPKTEENEFDLIAINAKRPITRQRFTAAHELCHYLKDARENTFVCKEHSKDYIERYAEDFAASFLMPEDELENQIKLRNRNNGNLSIDDVIIISNHFGCSFQACYYRIRRLFPYLLPYKNTDALKKCKIKIRRELLNLNYNNLYFDLFDSWEDINTSMNSEFSSRVFKNKYIFNDARIEGILTDYEAVAEIIEDLENNRQKSRFCSDKYDCFCHIAGHRLLFDSIKSYASKASISIYDLMSLNRILFSCFPHPEYGGNLRQNNTLVLGAKFETVDYSEISSELIKLNVKLENLEKNYQTMSRSSVIREVVVIHHRITVIHPFSDGNGRTSRAFMNIMLIRYGFLPIYIKNNDKSSYCNALELADKKENFDKLYEGVMLRIIQSHAELAETL